MNDAVDILIRYSLDQASSEPVRKRITIFRAAAALIEGDEGRSLAALADELATVEARQEQLLLKLRQEEVA